MESRETRAGAANPPAVQAPVAAEPRHARGAHAQHLGGLGGCRGRNVGKLNAHRQGDDGLTVEKQQRIYAPESENHSKAPQSCKVTLQDS